MAFPKHKIRILLGVLVLALVLASSALAAGGGSWPIAGQNLQNTRYQSSESKISVSTAPNLMVKWQFTTGGDVSATPAVDGTTVYFPDWAGNLYAVDENTGALVWQHKISDYTGIPGDFARVTPAVAGNLLFLGDQGGYFGLTAPAGARVIAVNKKTGDLAWATTVDSFQYSVITQSPVVDTNTTLNASVVYVGVASTEDVAAGSLAGYACCSFRGSLLALNAATGQILWKTYTVPNGYSGGDIASSIALDRSRGSLYLTTGSNTSVPAAVQACLAANPAAPGSCISPDDHFDSFVALDVTTGQILWATRTLAYDAWNSACLPGSVNPAACPQPAGPGYGFAQGPMLLTLKNPSTAKNTDLLVAGQKSGQLWALNPTTGQIIWSSQVGPGGIQGGMMWGSATDGSRIYVAEANSSAAPWNLVQNGQPSGVMVTSGFWSAVDAASGMIVWQTPDPAGYSDQGAVSAADGVVYGCSLDPAGHMYTLNGATGAVLWSFASGGSCASGAADVSGMLFWGSGYSIPYPGTANNKLYAFGVK